MPSKTKHSYEFEGYRLNAEPLGLWRDGQFVSLPPKVLEMLILLVERKGEIVTRDELLDTVWPDTHVEEGNIKYTVSLLRKALGKELVQTIPRRGYRFVAKVSEVERNGNGNPPRLNSAAAVSFETTANEEVSQIEPREIPKTRSRRVLFAAFLTAFVAASVAAMWWKFSSKPVPVTNTTVKSLAVLPLKNLDDDETSKAVSLGLASSLISRLGSLNRFVVRPLDAVESFAKGGGDAVKFADRLKVDSVLEGTIQTIDKRIRVNVRLINVRDGGQIWAASFVEAEDDVFKLQDQLALQVANSLVTRITQQEQSLLARKSTDNPEAYRACARGRAVLDRKNSDLLEKAVDEFQKSVAIDPAFAPAYAGLADAFLQQGNVLSGAEAAAAFNKAGLYAQKALQLGEESAEAYTALGRVKRYDWDWDGAERDFTRAIQLNPNHAEAHRYLAQTLSFRGRHDEANTEIKRAVEINPISPAITMAQFSILESRREYGEALKRAEEFARFDKENPLAKRAVATFLFHLGEHAKVIEIAENLTAKEEKQKFAFWSLLASSYQKTHQSEKADETLRQLEQLAQSDTKALYSLAMNYAELGRTDDAMWALEKCFELREDRVVWLNVEPRFANLRNDSRFQELVRKMHLG